MSVFPNWKEFVVSQRRPLTGCIPTGYETLLRAAGVSDVDFATFQDDFDLDKELNSGEVPQNNFESVSNAISRKYPHIQFKRIIFQKGEGQKKLQFIENNIRQKRLVLISLNMRPIANQAGWHIMPVVDMDDDFLYLVYVVQSDGNIQLMKLPKQEFVRIHEQFDGGDDVAYLE
jgi:hypothetical protein